MSSLPDGAEFYTEYDRQQIGKFLVPDAAYSRVCSGTGLAGLPGSGQQLRIADNRGTAASTLVAAGMRHRNEPTRSALSGREQLQQYLLLLEAPRAPLLDDVGRRPSGQGVICTLHTNGARYAAVVASSGRYAASNERVQNGILPARQAAINRSRLFWSSTAKLWPRAKPSCKHRL